MTNRGTVVCLALFAVAMAHVEAALVVHLRTIYYSGDPTAIFPLELMSHRDLAIELAREAATVVMIACVAALAARGALRRFAAFVLVFGLWDIFYYVWLRVMLDWPRTWLEWDVLFLIPWPWLGPWVCPALIAALFTVWGVWILLATSNEGDARFTRAGLATFLAGTALGLASFLMPALPLLPGGEEAFRGYVPGEFGWAVYGVGLVLMASGLWHVAWSATRAQHR